MDCSDSSDSLIEKKIVSQGSQFIPFVNETKVNFHYQTKTCPEKGEPVVIDDSKKMGRAMELVIGKKFKFEIWEAIIQKMSLHEVAKFRVHKSLVSQYPFISKTLRNIGKPHQHLCAMTLQNEGIGHKDLDELLTHPCDLEFTIEIISIERPDEYVKESWQLNDDEKLTTVQKFKEEGNELYRAIKIELAQEKYRQAIGMIEQLLMKEKPHDTEWLALVKLKCPILLNFAQCRLMQKDYYAVIEHCTEVLKHEPDNVKALYRRAKAHVGVWNPEEAKRDFERCMELDNSLKKAISKDLEQLNDEIKLNDVRTKQKLKSLFESD